MTDLEAVQVVAPIDYHLNPFFDIDTWWSVPLWVWLVVLIAGIFFAILIKWLRRKAIMAPTMDYLKALHGGQRSDQQSWLFGKNRSFYIEYLKYHDDGIISYPDMKKLSMWFLGSTNAVGHAGGIKNVILSDEYDRARDPIAEIALSIMIEEHNEKYPDNAITNFSEYSKRHDKVLELFPNGEVQIPVYGIWDPSKIQRFIPQNRSAGFNGGMLLRDARKLNVDLPEKGFWEKYGVLAFALGFAVVSIIMTYVFISTVLT